MVSPENQAGLHAVGLCKTFATRRVVDNISFHVCRGEVVGLLGPNGAGKTTAFYLMVGLLAVEQGRVFLRGEDITALPMHRRARRGIGYLPQDSSIFQKMTVEQNLLAVMPVCRVPRRQRSALCAQLLEKFQLTHVRKLAGISLSGGERRRVEIARALIGKPQFLLLDEPFSGIDPLTVQEIQALIADLRSEGLGVLITDHNVRETLSICDRVCVLAEGKVIAAGKPHTVAANPLVIKTYLGSDFNAT